MTPKEKAKELIDKYLDVSVMYGLTDYAKECALITVQECIDVTRGRYGDYTSMQYWLDVEKEINQYDNEDTI